MSASSNPADQFFQTTNSITETRRRALKSKNKNGDPIRLQSKVLAVIVDPDPRSSGGAVYVAESTATVRRIVLDTKEISPPFAGATAPLTCLALSPEDLPTQLFAGSWDRMIYSWSIPHRTPRRKFAGHSDFVKCITSTRLSLTGTEVLISGGADGRIIVWDIPTGNKVHVVEAHLRGVLDLAVLPPPQHFSSESGSAAGTMTLFGAGSVGEIRRFVFTPERIEEIDPEKAMQVHETSIYKLLFDADGDLWTASADADVVCLGREKGWAEEMRIHTGSWTRGVAIDEMGGWVLTGGRDEDVKVWERASGKLHHAFSGHYDEITGLVVLQGVHGPVVVSISLDGTIRQWSLKAADLQAARIKAADKEEGEGAEGEKEKRRGTGEEIEDDDVPERGDRLITEEEERELAELMLLEEEEEEEEEEGGEEGKG